MIHLVTEEISCCPVCKGSAKEFWAAANDRLHRTTEQIFEYSRCLDCGVLYQSIRPVEEDIWKCYPIDYGPHRKNNKRKTLAKVPKWVNVFANRLAERLVGVDAFRQRIAQIEEHLKQVKMMLDFGCGSGKYLDRARKFGCITIGMDFSSHALDQVRSRGHQALPVDDSSWETLGVGTVGFVRMNHVIEHLYDPEKVLRMICRAISRGGILHLSTPNPNGPSANRYRSAWWGLECPRHIVLIPPQRMAEILESVGFSKIEIVHEPLAKDLVRSWAYTRVDRGLLSSSSVEGLAEDGLLNLWFGRMVARALKRGESTDRYHVIAYNGI